MPSRKSLVRKSGSSCRKTCCTWLSNSSDMAARIIEDTISGNALADVRSMDEDDVEELVENLVDSCKLITQNTKRVAELIQSFKKLSVNLLGHERETVDLSEFSSFGQFDPWSPLNIEGMYRQISLHRRGN